MGKQETYSASELRRIGGIEGLLDKNGTRGRGRDKKPVKRKATKKNDTPYEHDEQVAFFRWAEVRLIPELYLLLWANPNGGYRHKKTASYLRAEGVKAGVLDVTFAYPCGGYAGLYMEIKRLKGGTVTKPQKVMINALRQAGYRAEVCKGCAEAQAVMEDYLQGCSNEGMDK